MKLDHQKLLQGRYEAERLPADFSSERIVPDFAFNALNPFGLLYRPVVDEDYLANGGQKPVWPDEKPLGKLSNSPRPVQPDKVQAAKRYL